MPRTTFSPAPAAGGRRLMLIFSGRIAAQTVAPRVQLTVRSARTVPPSSAHVTRTPSGPSSFTWPSNMLTEPMKSATKRLAGDS